MPLPWQLKFHGIARLADIPSGPVDIGVGGARGPGKSHCTFAQLTLDDCQRIPGLKGLFLRQTGKSAEESFQDLIDNILHGKIAYKWNSSRSTLTFANKSRVILGGFENEKDIDKYTGIQYDVIVIEERNQLTGEKITRLQGSLRTNKPNWRARMYSSFNPGNIGHDAVKSTFVTPHQELKETRTRFIPSTFKDNPFLKAEYVDYLNNIPDLALRRAWRDGNFDSFEGQYFTEWSRENHVCNPFPIPSGWLKYRAYDYGHGAPACCKWYAVDYDGKVWVYRELYYPKGHKRNADEQARDIVRLSGEEHYEYSIADPSIFSPTGMVDKSGGQTIAETFSANGVTFIRGSNRRFDGWSIMHEYLFWDNDHKPRIAYFNTCFDSIRTIPNLTHSTLKPEDVDTTGEDHAADVDRYFLTSLHETKTPKPKTDTEQKLEELKRRRDGIVEPSVLNKFYQNDYFND